MNLPFVSRKIAEEAQLQLENLNREFQNYRRRNGDLKETSYLQGKHDAVRQLLTVYDNLLWALEQPCEDEAFLKGIEMTRSSMMGTLGAMGITEIPALGEAFDPNLHEAMDHIQDETLGENIIVKVILTGFRQGDTVLRHALVVVAN